ncbi:MAG: translation initiation factor IF-2 N-terminal domain-containing protein, partial [Bacteroidales bacterium]|nr:translation initiation factor IF-2 N-terminal domain-containing protein [Bacteroidales bacterium]
MASFRLNKVAKDFNVGIQTLVDYLSKKGHQVEQNPNTKISDEQYELLAAAFQSERKVKEEADKIELTAGGANQVVEANQKETNDSDSDEVIIKSYTAPINSQPASTASVPQPEPTPKAEPEKATEETQEVSPAANPTLITPVESDDSPFNVVGKIDLSAINQRMRPDKKKKAKKQPAASAPEPAAAPKPKPADKPKPAPAPEPEPAPAPKPVQPEAVQPAEPEFIETQYQKLEGPKVLDKIDLSQFSKDGADTPGSKRKRKHTKKDAVSAQEVKKIGAEVAKKENKEKEKAKKESQKQAALQQPGGKKKKKKDDKKPVEIDEGEIEKQIRDTLARLSPLGKSKTSKHNREKRQKVHAQMEEEMMHEMEQQNVLQVTEFVTANELATMMNVPVTKIIATCMSVGIFVSINQRLDAETIKLITDEFGFEVHFADEDVVNTIHKIEEEDRPEDLVPRNPIITVM